MNDAVMRAQSYAVEVEHIMCDVFGCERSGVGGIVNSDFVRKHPLAAVTAICGFLYSESGIVHRERIEEFLSESQFYLKMSFDELLSFDTSSKVIDMITYELEYDNGEEALKDIIQKLRYICGLK